MQVDSAAAVESMNYGMSTVMTHKAFGGHAEEALEAVRYEAARLERLLSRFNPDSEVSRINRSAGIKCVKISEDTYNVLSRAVEFSKYCHGLFDVTIAPLVDLWSSCRNTCIQPDALRIRQVLSLVDYNCLLLDPCNKTAGLRKNGQSIDLGGIGKGYAGDKFLEVFRKYGVSSAFTNIGGNVAALGTKPDGSPWRIGIRHPRQEGSLIGLVSAAGKAVVTSGDYQRYFTGNDGKRYHHILDKATGYPAQSGLVSVTVVADNSMDADALSTILFVAGMNKGIEILKSFPGTEAVLIDSNLTAYITKGLKGSFHAEKGINVEILNN
jgi:thiamine biosynthesis lipoprotein